MRGHKPRAREYNTIAPLWSSGTLCCQAPTGITVYTGNQIPQWHNDLFMATYQTPRRVYHFYLNADRTAVTTVNVVTGVAANMDIETGPDGALWYIASGGRDPGTLYRLVGSGSATTPTAATPTPHPPNRRAPHQHPRPALRLCPAAAAALSPRRARR